MISTNNSQCCGYLYRGRLTIHVILNVLMQQDYEAIIVLLLLLELSWTVAVMFTLPHPRDDWDVQLLLVTALVGRQSESSRTGPNIQPRLLQCLTDWLPIVINSFFDEILWVNSCQGKKILWDKTQCVHWWRIIAIVKCTTQIFTIFIFMVKIFKSLAYENSNIFNFIIFATFHDNLETCLSCWWDGQPFKCQ